MTQNYKNMQYLSVNTEDYLRPLRTGHRRISRSISPGLDTMESLDECESNYDMRKTASSKSLLLLHKFTSSDSNLSTTESTTSSRKPFYKSSENLCFGRPKKRLLRQEQVSEIYLPRPRPRCNTDPVDTDRLRATIPVPTLTVPQTSNSACNSLASSVAPTPLLGRKHHQRRSSALSSLIEQALKVTTASMGLKAKTDERLTQQQTTKPINDDNVKRRLSSVSTFAAAPNDSTSMAPLQSHAETQSVTTLNLQDKETSPNGSNSSSSSRTQKQKQQQQHKRQSSNQSDNFKTAYSTTTSDSSKQNNSNNYRSEGGGSLNPIAPSGSTTSIRSVSAVTNTTAKHEQSTAAATAAAAATTAVPAEKEKKRKEVSSSRVKKFHRHFTQVSKDEKLINYFSCALVSDILLQGHLYITDQHFAFYSNVFGYVTKVVIPTSSVTKISKEKLAKIIPNAVGVATADERHVFGSFMSREAAFRLMCSVCPPLVPIENLPKAPADIEISEEYSIEDDSSCSISGNESPPQALGAPIAGNAGAIDELGQTLIRRNVAGSSVSIADGTAAANQNQRHSDIPIDAKEAGGAFSNSNLRASAPPSSRYNSNNGKTASGADGGTPNANTGCGEGIATTGIALIVTGANTSGSSSPTPSTSSSLPVTVMASTPKSAAHAAVSSFKTLTQKALLRLKFPTELHVVYLGVLLTMVLALFSVFLLYRILDIEAKTSAYRSPTEFNWRAGTDDDIFAEALRWQKELQAKSTEEAQDILTHNLEQIAKVRRSLETLSMLIHDRSSAYEQRDESD
uniref:GRAM domain-containing protein YSP2 n=1 Tax=Zeugodacus cucurbitae TaxID=28588 RepID=A0A0A1XMB4_ZEUCU